MSFRRKVKANKPDVWKVISDVENYHEVAGNIDEVKIVSGEKEGMVRACSHGEDSWTEKCSLWEEEKEYSFEVDTSAPNYPFKVLRGNWQVKELADNKTEIIMNFEFEYTKSIHNLLLHPLMKHKFIKIY